jgi:hypothetical protein
VVASSNSLQYDRTGVNGASASLITIAAALQSIAGPTIVCVQAGNVNTGDFDPIAEVGEAVHASDAWLHVDGAFGLWVAASLAHRNRTGRGRAGRTPPRPGSTSAGSVQQLPRTHVLLFSDIAFVYRSTDVGQTWSKARLVPTPRDSLGEANIWVLLSAADGMTVYAVSASGVYQSDALDEVWHWLS